MVGADSVVGPLPVLEFVAKGGEHADADAGIAAIAVDPTTLYLLSLFAPI